MYGIMKNYAEDLNRKARALDKRFVQLDHEPSAGGSLEDQLIREETDIKVREAVSELKPAFRDVVELRHFSELSYDEIASRLNVPEGTVKSRLHKARSHLKANLAELRDS